MDSVGLLAVGVCTVSLLSLFVYWRVLDRSAAMFDGDADIPSSASVAEHAETEVGAEQVTCSHCGAKNDAHSMVTFCWRCAERLQPVE